MLSKKKGILWLRKDKECCQLAEFGSLMYVTPLEWQSTKNKISHRTKADKRRPSKSICLLKSQDPKETKVSHLKVSTISFHLDQEADSNLAEVIIHTNIE